jgi:hypothetical protein
MQMLVEETDITTNMWTHLMEDAPHYLTYLFLPIVVHMDHDQWDRLKDYWPALEHVLTAFYRNTMKRDWFFHAGSFFLHVSDNKSEHDKTDKIMIGCGK